MKNLPNTSNITSDDLGLNNIISIAFCNGDDGVVVFNSKIEKNQFIRCQD